MGRNAGISREQDRNPTRFSFVPLSREHREGLAVCYERRRGISSSLCTRSVPIILPNAMALFLDFLLLFPLHQPMPRRCHRDGVVHATALTDEFAAIAPKDHP